MKRITFEEKIQFHTERFIEGLREGKKVDQMMAFIIQDAAHWGGENVKSKRQASS